MELVPHLKSLMPLRARASTVTRQEAISTRRQVYPMGKYTPEAGLMVRQSNYPTSPYYAVFLKPNNKLVVQYRAAFGGTTTAVTQANIAAPLYLEIQRVGDLFQAAISNDGVTYTLVPGTNATLP